MVTRIRSPRRRPVMGPRARLSAEHTPRPTGWLRSHTPQELMALESAPVTLAPGTLLSSYRLVEKLGEGGMGVVWRAVDETLDRQVAVKILPDLFAQDPERLARFEREAKVLASLNHPGIATIFGLEQADGMPFLVMEYVEGKTLPG